MATRTVVGPNSAAKISAASPEADLLVVIYPNGYWACKGTRAQLMAEGFVPPTVAWPDAFDGVEWTAGRAGYRLARCRPQDHRGPKSSWVAVDYWVVSGRSLDPGNSDLMRLRRLSQHVRAERLAMGHGDREEQAAHDEARRRYYAALDDRSFQAFKRAFLGRRQQAPRVPNSP